MPNKKPGLIGMSLGALLITASILMVYLNFPHAGIGWRKIALGIIGLLFLISGVFLFFVKNNISNTIWELMVNSLNIFWQEDFFIANVLIPLCLLGLYCISFVYFSATLLLPIGTNYYFSKELFQFVILALIISLFITIYLVIKVKKKRAFAFRNSIGKLSFPDLLLLLLPLIPVVQYILKNQQILSPVESVSVAAFFLLLSGLYIFAIPALFGIFGSPRTLMVTGLTFALTITNMALLSRFFSWFNTGDFNIQLIFFIGVFIVCMLLYTQQKKIFNLFIVVMFVANTSIQLISPGKSGNGSSIPSSENKLLSLVEGRNPASTPNAYLLVYDAYVSNETMLAYGINNQPQEDYLKKQGFTLYPQTYSVGATTIDTMSRVLNASTSFYGNIREGISGNGIVQNIYKSLGYKTYGIFPTDYEFRGIYPSYNFSFPEFNRPDILLSKAILVGEFRFDLDYSNITHQQYVETKQSIFNNLPKTPVFIYTHSNLPAHSQNSGACLPNEAALYKERVDLANIEMQQDIKIITGKDPSAMIIIASDHGPYLTKNCIETGGVYPISEISRLDIQDRYGTFLAIRWPSSDYTKYDHITVLQDLFPAIFAYLFKDTNILEAKIIPETTYSITISGASVNTGIIHGGINNGEPLFLSGK